jgi:hypothetical protein
MRACLNEFVKRKLPVIPVLLPGAPAKPDLPLFLQAFTWVDLRSGLTDDGLDRLEWGITGVKPKSAAASLPPVVRSLSPSPSTASSAALAVWREKLEYLRQQEAITADPAQKFALKKQIEEAEQKIHELGN